MSKHTLKHGQIVEIPIRDIHVNGRSRQIYGDLAGLAENIKTRGLFHPIGVNPDGVLLFGERRLRAIADHLGWEKIKAHVLDVDSLDAELDENDQRLNLTLSERHTLLQRIEERLPNRRGRPRKGAEFGTLNGKTRDIAARKAGFASNHQAHAVGEVLESGDSTLISMMDSERIAPSAAAAVAKLPATQRAEVVKAGARAVKRAAATVRATITMSRAAIKADQQKTLRKQNFEVWEKMFVSIGLAMESIEQKGGIKTIRQLWTGEDRKTIRGMLEEYRDKLNTIISELK